MLSLSFLLAGCSDYKLRGIFEDGDTGGTPEDTGSDAGGGIASEPAPDYPVDLLLYDCVALDADACPDNDDEGGIDTFCSDWVTPRRTSLDNAVRMMLADYNSGRIGIGAYTIFEARVPSHESGPDADGETNSAAMALIPGAEDVIREAIVAWEADRLNIDDLDLFPLNAIVCRVSVSEFENGDAAYQFIQGHQDASASSNDVSDAVIANVSDMPEADSVNLSVQPEFGMEDELGLYQYLEGETPYDIDRGMDEVVDVSREFLTTAAFFAGVDESVADQATYSTLYYYGVE